MSDLRDDLRALVALRDELRTMALVAGQASVETFNLDDAAAGAKVAEYCAKWADQLDAILARLEAEPISCALKDDAEHWKAETERLRMENEALEKELHTWRTKRLHGGCQEDLLAEIAARADAEAAVAALTDKNAALKRELEKADIDIKQFESDMRALNQPASGTAETFDFRKHLQRQREWSERTFGPGMRTAGIIDHITKELREIEADTADLKEWIDVVILGLDGAWRAGHSPDAIIAALAAKQAKNEARIWPDWRTQPLDKAIEHERDKPNSGTSETIQLARRKDTDAV